MYSLSNAILKSKGLGYTALVYVVGYLPVTPSPTFET